MDWTERRGNDCYLRCLYHTASFSSMWSLVGRAVVWVNPRMFWLIKLKRTLLNRAVPGLICQRLGVLSELTYMQVHPNKPCIIDLSTSAHLLRFTHLFIHSYFRYLWEYFLSARHPLSPWKYTAEIRNTTNEIFFSFWDCGVEIYLYTTSMKP
jgi:hypothetical protein